MLAQRRELTAKSGTCHAGWRQLQDPLQHRHGTGGEVELDQTIANTLSKAQPRFALRQQIGIFFDKRDQIKGGHRSLARGLQGAQQDGCQIGSQRCLVIGPELFCLPQKFERRARLTGLTLQLRDPAAQIDLALIATPRIQHFAKCVGGLGGGCPPFGETKLGPMQAGAQANKAVIGLRQTVIESQRLGGVPHSRFMQKSSSQMEARIFLAGSQQGLRRFWLRSQGQGFRNQGKQACSQGRGIGLQQRPCGCKDGGGGRGHLVALCKTDSAPKRNLISAGESWIVQARGFSVPPRQQGGNGLEADLRRVISHTRVTRGGQTENALRLEGEAQRQHGFRHMQAQSCLAL